MKVSRNQNGFTLVELLIGIVVLAVVAISFAGLFTSLVNSSLVAKRKAVASSLATNYMEYLKSLPYDTLAVAGGSIYTASPLPASSTQKSDGFSYVVKTSINYVDDAFDGCGSYPTQTIKEKLCRNYPPPASASATDTNAADYKIVHVAVQNTKGATLAASDTQIAARVAETSSTTGALIVNVIDANGNPVQGASVAVTNTTITPNVSVGDSTDSNGLAIFYGLPPDSGTDYKITASNTNYSSLATISPSGSLQPTYSSQKIFTQLSSYITLPIKPQGADSLLVEAINTSGTALSGLKIYVKGGYKKYTLTTDTSYYFDNLSPSDTRPSTDVGGLTSLRNLVPGPYVLCGDTGATSCTIGATTYYLVAAIPYTGSTAYSAVNVPNYLASSPPATTFLYGGNNYIQKARLILTTNSSYPRVYSLSPNEASITTGGLSTFAFTVKGVNLPCSSTAASCSTIVSIKQGANTFPASCTGAAAGLTLSCKVNLSTASVGATQLSLTASGNNYTSPADLSLGSINVVP